jgi:uncharacterized protein
MKIRSITYFCDPRWPLAERVIQRAGNFLAQARRAYEAEGFEVQTLRLATVPFPHMLGKKQMGELPKMAQKLEKEILEDGIAYAALGPALPNHPGSYEIIPEAIAATQSIFFSAVMANKKIGISLKAVEACAGIIQKVSSITADGFANLRFAALANVKAGSPFFPAAYWDGTEPAFALATESADLAVEAFRHAETVDEGRRKLIDSIEKHAARLTRTAKKLKDVRFGGIDFSLASFPAGPQSLGTAFEKLGVKAVGLHGSLAAAAILTECIDRAHFPRTGFSGLMMPVLEDATLAQRAAEGTLSVKDVLLYSAVCGTGLDTIPLPGSTKAPEIAPLLLDLCALALRLDKPLTARLMPIPGKKAGDPTSFDFAFFANSRVMALDSAELDKPLKGDRSFTLEARSRS